MEVYQYLLIFFSDPAAFHLFTWFPLFPILLPNKQWGTAMEGCVATFIPSSPLP
jgi:hypothetical protein